MKAANGMDAHIVGSLIASYLQQAFQTQNFTFHNQATFTLSSSELEVEGLLPVWGTYVSTTIVFTNATGLDISLIFQFNITQVGGLEGIVKKIAPSQWSNDFNQLVISNALLTAELESSGAAEGLTLSGQINLAADGPYGQVLVDFIKAYENPLALSFLFPISSTKSLTSFKLGFNKNQLHKIGSVGGIHFSICLPGTYTVSSDIWATQVCLQIGSTGITITSNLIVQAGNQNLTFAAQGQFQEGQPITLTGNLESKWVNPFGLNWISFSSGTFTVVLSAQPQITLQGNGFLTFDADSSVSIGLSLGFKGFVFSINGVPVTDLPGLYQAVSGKAAPHMLSSISVQGFAGMTIASFNDGQYQEGLTLIATSVISSSTSELLKAQQQLQPSATAGSTNFVFKIFIPIFTPEDPVVISLTYSSTLPLHTGLQCTSYSIVATIGATQVSLVIGGNFAVQPQGNQQAVTFTMQGTFAIGQSTTLSGQLTSPWNNVFGATWLTITQASATLNLGKISSSDALNIAATGIMKFSTQTDTVNLNFQSGDDFTQFCFSGYVDSVWNVSVVADGVTGSHVPTVGDVNVQDDVKYSLAVCNYAGGVSPNGFTLGTTGTVVNNLARRLAPLSPNQIPILNFDITLYLPCFSSDPGAFKFYLDVQEPLAITPHITFNELTFNLQGGQSGYGSLEIKYQANLNNNPAPIGFDVKGVVTDTGSITLTGFETGVWNDIFGIQGFDLSNVDCEIQFGPTGLSDLGVGFTTVTGTKTITFAGNLAAPDFFDCFIEGSVTAGPGSLILDFSDLALLWNKNVPNHQINMANVPNDMGLQSAFISLAGQSGQFGSYSYEEGFHVKATMLMIDITFAVDVGCQVSGLSPSCDFNVNVNVDKNAIEAELKKFITMTSQQKYHDPNFVVWKLNSCGLSQWATSLLSEGLNPMWQFDFTIFGRDVNLNFRSELQDLEGSFQNFYDKYIKHIF